MFTKEGLPLDHTRFGIAITTTDLGDHRGPARRIDCRPPQLITAPSISSKRSYSGAPRARLLKVGPNHSSLIDDDEDELVDYFGMSRGDSAPLATETVSSSSHWNVRDHNVPTLPSFYPLEKSAVFVPQASAPILATRIAAVLQARSIVASFSARNAKVDCVSKSHVELRIRLYRGRGEYKQGIIVEVQRRLGFDLSYMQDVNAILDAAEGKTLKDCGGGTSPIYNSETEGSCSSEGEDMEIIGNTGESASLRVISDILCPQVVDKMTVEASDLALVSLASLTSLDCMGPTAVQLSKELLISEAHANLRHAVFSNVCPLTHSQGKDAIQRAILQSLEILANVAVSAQSPSLLVELLSQNDHDILIKLITNIENAQLNPRAADLSCGTITSIFKSQAKQEGIMMPQHCRERLSTALMESMSYGEEYHAELERHSQQCFEVIQL